MDGTNHDHDAPRDGLRRRGGRDPRRSGCISGGNKSSAGDGGSSNSSSGSSSGGADGGATFSCYEPANSLCTEEVAPESAMSAEQQECANMGMGGTFASGPCPTAGLVACCVKYPVTQCYYSAFEASIGQMTCNNGGVWTPVGDGGTGGDDSGSDGAAATNPQAWVGTWARSGNESITCGTGAPTNDTLTGNVTIALGTASDGIMFKQPNGCMFDFTVSGNTATVMAGQTCVENIDGGTNTITEVTHTLTLSDDGMTITSVDSNTEEKSTTQVTCTVTANATLTM